MLSGRRIVLGICGGIAAYKSAGLARLLVKAGATVEPVITRGGSKFIGAATLEGITGQPVRTEVWDRVDEATHIALARRTDAIVVYPATAHFLAKVAGGLADDLLTNTALAARCPTVLCPAMHTEMWEHPATLQNADILRARGITLLGPARGELMGGDAGLGRAVEPEEVFDALVDVLTLGAGELAGVSVVVTAGGTREPIDPVRFLGNRSSGKMGFAIAHEAARRGAAVHLVTGPASLEADARVTRHDVLTAVEMRDVVVDLAKQADVVVKAAAVADFRPVSRSQTKLKKADGPPTIALEPNPDILHELVSARGDGTRPILVGFAAETDNVEANARAKFDRKRADLLVVNDVSADDAGFSVDTNRVFILGLDIEPIEVALTSKAQIAARVWDEVVRLLG